LIETVSEYVSKILINYLTYYNNSTVRGTTFMSTTFKIIENHIENTKTSPKKSVALASSHLSPTSNAFDSEDEID
jgi:hypothetical protein